MAKFPHDIDDLDQRIDTFKKQSIKKDKISAWGGFATAFQIVIEFVAPVFVGLCMGYILDNIFTTKPLFLITLALFGCAAGLLNIYRAAKGIEENINRE